VWLKTLLFAPHWLAPHLYELPKNVWRVDDATCVHRMSADVRIPSGHGGWEAHSYTGLALGR